MAWTNEDNKNADGNENILYEILIYSEWAQEPETIGRLLRDKEDENQGVLWGWFPYFSVSKSMPSNLQKYYNAQMPWQLAVGGEGRVVAIVQHDVVEIRSSREDYATVIGKGSIPRDPCPQWRKTQWSPDCSLLAVASSKGNIYFFDLLGSNIFTITLNQNESINNGCDVSDAIAGMAFASSRVKNTQWSSEFIVVTFKGMLHSFLVSCDGYQENHVFSLTNQYLRGVTGIVLHPSNNLLVVSGINTNINRAKNETLAKGVHYGITTWRLLSDYPHYKLSTSIEGDDVDGKNTFLSRIPLPFRYNCDSNYVVKMSLSPNGQTLAAIHSSGALSFWNYPSMRLRRLWELVDQPGFDALNPQVCEPGVKRKSPKIATDNFRSQIADLNWWSDDKLIVARFSGAVVVASSVSLRNLLGQSPEWFEPAPQVSLAHDRGFLGLECEQVTLSKKITPNLSKQEESSDEEENAPLLKQSIRSMKTALYYLTDSERFQPPKKKTKLITKTYRLLSLKSTTPDELFLRKLDNEEYGEALALAKVYSLDCDLVYQRQWRKSPVSVASIQDYLSKITKRTWVLHECIERVPENIDAARELLLYGLRGCELESVVDIGLGKDKGRFVAASLQQAFSFDESENEDGKDDKSKKRLEALLRKVDFQILTLEQKQLCQYRLTLLSYLDRLNTYEIILGGGQRASDHYSHTFFKTFRTQSCLESSINFAQRGDWRAVSHMFTYHGSDTLTHRLPIISNIPETISPYDYRDLLPEAGFRPDEPEVYPWDEISVREPDWVETYYESLKTSEDDFETDFYESNDNMQKYKVVSLTTDLLTKWYTERALEIEKMSDLVDNALELVKCGRERNVQGLEKLHDDLVLLETLVYECHLERPISYQNLQEMKDIEKLRLLMSSSKKENFIKNVRQWLIPFLNRTDKHNPGSKATLLRDYVMGLAKSDILQCRLLLEASRPDCQDPVISNIELLITVALDSVYSCEKDDELESCCAILECLPDRNAENDSEELNALHNRVDELEKHLTVANILLKHGLPTSPAFIKNCEDNTEEIKKLFIALSNTACSKKPPLEEKRWKELLQSILEMRNKVFDKISIDDCYEIVINALLCSGSKKNIEFCSELMERSVKSSYSSNKKKLPLSKAIDLVITAGQKYFNISSSLDDPSIALAKCCFSLIEDHNPNIEEELDLILSLSLLKDFKVNMIPLQVRLCKDRMQLILKAISATPNAYKNSQKLLRLATLVRVDESDKTEREGKVLRLVAEAAYQAEDFNQCYQACQQLIELRYEDSWPICYQLGSCAEFKDVSARGQLLSFALIYCSDDLIATLIPARRELELEEINSQMKLSVENTRSLFSNKEDDDSDEEESDNAVLSSLKQTKDKTMKVLQTTTETTKAVLATVGNHNFWRDAVKWVGSISEDNDELNNIENNKEFSKIGIDAFRCENEDSHISKFHTNYDKYSMPDIPNHLKISRDIFRAAMIDETLEKSVSQQLTSEFILDIAKHMIPEDTALGLGYLLSLKRAKDAAVLFDSLPQSVVVLELASFYFCLAFFSQTLQKSKDLVMEKLLKEEPDSLIRKCTKMISKIDPTDLSEDALMCRKLFLKYHKLHSEYVQAEFLTKLNNEMDYDVDVEKFFKDDEYKHQIILKLASFSEEHYSTAKCLALRYEVNMTHFYIKRLCFLLEKTGSISEIERKLKEPQIKETLYSDPKLFSQLMENDVLPLINGLDHGKMLYYYSLLMDSGDLQDSYGNKPSFHIKLLQKLKHINNSAAVNYAKLMSPYKSTSVLEEVLNKENIHAFSKFADRIPVSDSSGFKFHSSSSIFRIFCEAEFFAFEIEKPNCSAREWIQRYQSSSSYFSKMTASDYLQYVNTITFNIFAVTKLPLECRVEINRRALKYCLEKESNDESLKDVINEINRNLNHLKKLDDEIVLSLRESSDKTIQVYAIQFDMTRSVPEKIEAMLIQAVMECLPLPTVQDLLALAPMELGLDPEEIYTKSIKTVVKCISHPNEKPPDFLIDKDAVKILRNILESVVFDNEILSEDSILDILRPFLSDESSPSDNRIAISVYLEQTFMLSEEDLQSIFLYKSQALLKAHFPDVQVSENDVQSTNSLAELYKTLIPRAKSSNQLFSLAKWLLWWPSIPKTTSLEPSDNIWIPLLSALINYAGQDKRMDEVLKLIELIFESTKFNLQCINVLYERISVVGNICHALKLVVLAQEPKLYGVVKELVRYKDELIEGSDFDSQVLNWIVNRRLTSVFVSTPLYQHISNYLLNTGSKESCTKVIGELEAAGFKEEAKTLRQMSKNPSSLTTAISALRHWLPKNE